MPELYIVVFSSVITASVLAQNPCNRHYYGEDSFVCICNETQCDTVEQNTRQVRGVMTQYVSSLGQFRLNRVTHKFQPNATWSYKFTINRSEIFQTIIGFGGAFTDAAGINIMNLPPKAQDKLLSSYYAPSGIEYTVGRIPMASCDFSTHPYSYDDHPGDLNLTLFALAPEDLKYKIPIIQRAISMSKRNISIFGSPWSAPAWMKTDNNMTGKGSLKGEAGGPYHKAWAKYFIRFLQEYEKHNIKLWGLTAQNEPTDGEIAGFFFQCMGWTPEQQRDFIIQDLGPALHENGYGDVKLMVLDDTRLMLPYWVDKVFSNSTVGQYVAGIAVHWYLDKVTPDNALDIAHNMVPDKYIFGTEACQGELPWQEKVALGSWQRGQTYAHDIIQVVARMWNLAVPILILLSAILLIPVFTKPAVKKYISGIGVHWYQDPFLPTLLLDNTHKKYPFLFILATEACESTIYGERSVVLGSWRRAEDYAHSMIQDLNHWVTGWTDWNIALDTEGGPNWVKNFVDSPIIVNSTAKEFYKQPMFYAMGHFSKFIVPGAKRVGLKMDYPTDSLESVAFVLPDESNVVVILNNDDAEYQVSIEDPARGNVSLNLQPKSLHTFIWWNQ